MSQEAKRRLGLAQLPASLQELQEVLQQRLKTAQAQRSFSARTVDKDGVMAELTAMKETYDVLVPLVPASAPPPAPPSGALPLSVGPVLNPSPVPPASTSAVKPARAPRPAAVRPLPGSRAAAQPSRPDPPTGEEAGLRVGPRLFT